METLVIITNFSIIIPIAFWLKRRKEISDIYFVFSFHLIAGLINELIHYFIQTELVGEFSSLTYYLIETQCILFVLLTWLGIKRNEKYIYQITFFLIWIVDLILNYALGQTQLKWMYLVSLCILVVLGIKVVSKTNIKNAMVIKLVLVPYIVYAIYFIVINLFMYWLYNKQNQQLFINLYSVINLINFLSYISYSLALLWAPKKERYL